MTSFNDSLHPRGQAANAGQFAAKTNDPSAGSLGDRAARMASAASLEAELSALRMSRVPSDEDKAREAELRAQWRENSAEETTMVHMTASMDASNNPADASSSEGWIPASLPQRLHHVAFATDLIRRMCDSQLPQAGRGACLPASAVVGHFCQGRDLDGRLVQGCFGGEPHWWVELEGFVFDPTAGQFGDGLPSISQVGEHAYSAESRWPCGHSSHEMLYAEAYRSFGDSAEAEDFIDLAVSEALEGERLAQWTPLT